MISFVYSLTFYIAAVGDFENRLPWGNDEKECDCKTIEKFLGKSQYECFKYFIHLKLFSWSYIATMFINIHAIFQLFYCLIHRFVL